MPQPLGYQQSCILNLSINGSALNGNILSGPIVCSQGNPSQCYQPSAANSLNITKGSATDYTVGGSVFGLSGTLVLENNGGDALTMNADGTFTFSNALPLGSAYLVTVQSQPATQTCTVSNGSGTISNATNVSVNCSTNTRTVGGSVSGLRVSESVVLQNNGGDNLTVNSNGSFTFSTPVAQAASYKVTVLTQPTTQTCTVTNGSGTAGAANISNVQVTCATNAYTVGGSVSGYGCIYQGGYVYALDDTSSNSGSVGGKVATITDQATYPNGIVWGSNGGTGGSNLADTSYDNLPGIDETSTSATGSPTYSIFASFFSNTYTNANPFTSASFSMCNGIADGACNTGNILMFYNQFITNNTFANGGIVKFTASAGPTIITYYAAGLCKQTIASYSDWYLPAICELGYGSSAACGASGTPTLQNMQSSLIDISGLSTPAGYYWSSTEYSGIFSLNYVWSQLFDSVGSTQAVSHKEVLLGVRCSRALTL